MVKSTKTNQAVEVFPQFTLRKSWKLIVIKISNVLFQIAENANLTVFLSILQGLFRNVWPDL